MYPANEKQGEELLKVSEMSDYFINPKTPTCKSSNKLMV